MKNKWKTIAIIFIILFVLETLFLIYAFNLANRIVSNENECLYNVCADYEAYFYDDYDEVCYCYEDNEVAYYEYLKPK